MYRTRGGGNAPGARTAALAMGAGAGGVSTVRSARTETPDPAHEGPGGPAPVTDPGAEHGPAGRGFRSPWGPQPRLLSRLPRSCPGTPGHVRPRDGFRSRRRAPPLSGLAPPLPLTDQSLGATAPCLA